MPIVRLGDLDIAVDNEVQRRTWAWQRVAWCVMALTVVAALVGFFGEGPLGRASAGAEGDPLRARYHRFGRYLGPMTLEIDVLPGPSGEVPLWLDADYVDAAGVERVDPRPDRVVAGPDGTTFVLRAEPSRRAVRVSVRLKPERVGYVHARVRAGAGPGLTFSHWIYP